MISTEHRYTLLRRLAWSCALAVLLVTALSAYLRLGKAGLGCADWPACYGQPATQLASEMAAGSVEAAPGVAMARLAHRVLAVAVLLLAIGMSMLALGARPLLRRAGGLALAVLLLAVGLAVLGRYSSGTRVPAVAIGNLLGGLLMFAACVRLTMAGRVPGPRLRGWALAAALLVLMQVGLGGLVSASFAGLSCTAADDCNLAAAWQASGWSGLDPWREARPAAQPGATEAGRMAHSLHRHAGIVVAAVLALLGFAAWRRGQRRAASLLWLLVALQVLAGVLLVMLGLPLPLALAHNLLAALLLATVVVLV